MSPAERVGRPGVAIGAGGTALLLCLAGCADAGPPRFEATVAVEDGVEVARIPDLPGPLDPALTWTLDVVQSVPTATTPEEEPLLFDPVRLLPLADGSWLVHDPTAERPLVVVEPGTGAATVRFGRRGRGPGELGNRLTLAQDPGGDVVVLDHQNGQLHTFGVDGTRRDSRRWEYGGRPFYAEPTPDGTAFVVEAFLDGAGERYRGLRRSPVDGGAGSTLFRLPREPGVPEMDGVQQGRSVFTLVGEGIVAMWSALPTVEVRGPDGALLRRLELPWERRELTDADVQREIARVGALARGLRPGPAALTNALYALSDSTFGMLLSNLWRAASDPPLPPERLFWRLLSVHGTYLGVVPLPEGARVLHAGDGRIWLRALDGSGVPVVQEVVPRPPSGP